jgi:hypothetical protein
VGLPRSRRATVAPCRSSRASFVSRPLGRAAGRNSPGPFDTIDDTAKLVDALQSAATRHKLYALEARGLLAPSEHLNTQEADEARIRIRAASLDPRCGRRMTSLPSSTHRTVPPDLAERGRYFGRHPHYSHLLRARLWRRW